MREYVTDRRPDPRHEHDSGPCLNEVRESGARRFVSRGRGGRIRRVTRGRERIPANRHDELLHRCLPEEVPCYFDEHIRTLGRGTRRREPWPPESRHNYLSKRPHRTVSWLPRTPSPSGW